MCSTAISAPQRRLWSSPSSGGSPPSATCSDDAELRTAGPLGRASHPGGGRGDDRRRARVRAWLRLRALQALPATASSLLRRAPDRSRDGGGAGPWALAAP